MQVFIRGQLSRIYQPYVYQAVLQGLEDMPLGIIRLLINSGVTTYIAKRMTDIDPSAAYEKARGWEGKAEECASAMYCWNTKRIMMSQEVRVNQVPAYEPAPGNKYIAYLHEVGHAVDDAGNYSRSDKMLMAYESDINKLIAMDTNQQKKLIQSHRYYFSKLNGGTQTLSMYAREEVFAEAFAHILGGMFNGDAEPAFEHKRVFAHCYTEVEAVIRAIAPDAVLYPKHLRSYDRIKDLTPA